MTYQMGDLYDVDNEGVKRENKFSPHAGEGYFLAEHDDRRTCGKTGYMERK